MRFSTNMKQILTLSLAIIPLLSWAYDTEVDGFAYNLNEKTKEAEVTYGWNNYVGDVVIPSSMTFEGITYSVTSIGQCAFAYCSPRKDDGAGAKRRH